MKKILKLLELFAEHDPELVVDDATGRVTHLRLTIPVCDDGVDDTDDELRSRYASTG